MKIAQRLRPVIRYTDPGILRAKRDGRSYWQVRYRDGKIVNEWDHGADWVLLPRRHPDRPTGAPIVEARLLCPNGDVGVVGNSVDASDRIFQFKIAGADQEVTLERAGATVAPEFPSTYKRLEWILTGKGLPLRRVYAQVLGMLHGVGDADDAACTVWAWEYPGRLIGPFEDTFPSMRYGGPATATLYQEHLGVKAD